MHFLKPLLQVMLVLLPVCGLTAYVALSSASKLMRYWGVGYILVIVLFLAGTLSYDLLFGNFYKKFKMEYLNALCEKDD